VLIRATREVWTWEVHTPPSPPSHSSNLRRGKSRLTHSLQQIGSSGFVGEGRAANARLNRSYGNGARRGPRKARAGARSGGRESVKEGKGMGNRKSLTPTRKPEFPTNSWRQFGSPSWAVIELF
jgi:hypothetical protein